MTDTETAPSSEASGGVRWFAGYGPLEAIRDYHGDCRHVAIRTVAVGSTERTDRLMECDECLSRGWWTRVGRPAGRWRTVARP